MPLTVLYLGRNGMNIAQLSITVSAAEQSGVDRQGDMLLGGVPLQRGSLREAGWFNLRSEASKTFTVKGTPAAY